MKINVMNMAAFAVMLALGTSCNQKSDQDAKIQALEDKIAQLETGSTAITPVNAQAAQVADPATLGSFVFPDMEYDFGAIKEGEVIEHLFKFTNNGQAPLVISNITASCGCTSPDWSKAPVKPGEDGYVKVVFNSTSKSGAQAPTVSIQANTNPSVTRLRLKGTVTPKIAGAATPVGPVKR
jgi:outer membrane murein-binding lipoprotein Lpp